MQSGSGAVEGWGMSYRGIPGKHRKNDGKSPFLMGISTFAMANNGHFPIRKL